MAGYEMREEREIDGERDDGVEVGDSAGSALYLDDDGAEFPEDAIEEWAAVEESEGDTLAAAQAVLEAERGRTRAALERYREAVLAADPELPAELVQGDTLEEIEASLATVRAAVAEVRARLDGERVEQAGRERGFPVGAPARLGPTTAGLSAAEKIRRGLEEQARR